MVGDLGFSFSRAGASALAESTACHARHLPADVFHRGRQTGIKRTWKA
jgi:hypothetical protein